MLFDKDEIITCTHCDRKFRPKEYISNGFTFTFCPNCGGMSFLTFLGEEIDEDLRFAPVTQKAFRSISAFITKNRGIKNDK